jgi:hypothetical protein
MRFADASKGTRTDVLSPVVAESTLSRTDGPREGNPAVRPEWQALLVFVFTISRISHAALIADLVFHRSPFPNSTIHS